MWFATRQEGFDDPRPATRGPCVDLPGAVFCGSINGNSFLLRGGFLLQFLSLSGLFIAYWASGGYGLFGYALQGMSEEGGPECLFFSYIRCLHAVCLSLYAAATYLLEVYHDEGAGDLHAYINSALFGFASLLEFCVLFVPIGGASSLSIWLALLAASTWAVFFEPEVNNVSPALHETELTNDVEQQVEKFARMSPYYPTEEQGGRAPSMTMAPSHSASFVQAPSQQFQQQASVVAQAYESEGRPQ
ncbi:hypothetical protein Emed_003786 [Eimeria media]